MVSASIKASFDPGTGEVVILLPGGGIIDRLNSVACAQFAAELARLSWQALNAETNRLLSRVKSLESRR